MSSNSCNSVVEQLVDVPVERRRMPWCGWKQPLRQQMLLLLLLRLPRQRCSMLMTAAGVGVAAGSCISRLLEVGNENHSEW